EPFAALGVHSLPMPRVAGPGDLTTPLAIRRLADTLAIDVLHGHGAKGGLYARLGKLGTRRAALYTTHGGVLHFSPRSGQGILFQTFERLLLPVTDAVVFESHFARDAFHRLIGRPKCPDPVIHNGLTPAEFEPVIPQPDARDFVFIGEFRELKGIHYLLEALTDVTASDGRPATLVMAGGGPDFDRFKAEIGVLGLETRVTLVGVRPARAVLPQGRIAVVPSLAESLPYVVLEAAAAGLPVIATRVGGIPEIFGPTADSLVPPADTAGLRAAMQAALDAPQAARREAEARLAHIRSEFSIARMTDAIEALYRQLLAGRES
ncbi:MAG TPA: glycosyltransferase family 4 protein, partial [Alphaproteobacteria bacterium]|nr:glycosyltransferase family 4 protein [Alphaproteobacteria bacterium]